MSFEITGVPAILGSYEQTLLKHYQRIALTLHKRSIEPKPIKITMTAHEKYMDKWRKEGTLRKPYDAYQKARSIVRAAIRTGKGKVTFDDVFSDNRTHPVCQVRAACIWRMKEKHGTTVYMLAIVFGRDRNSIRNALKQHRKSLLKSS